MRFTVLTTSLLLGNSFGFAPLATTKSWSAVIRSTPKVSTIPLFKTSDDFADTALTISEAAASLRGQTIVVKYGGNAMICPS
jgi:hypothetical protein